MWDSCIYLSIYLALEPSCAHPSLYTSPDILTTGNYWSLADIITGHPIVRKNTHMQNHHIKRSNTNINSGYYCLGGGKQIIKYSHRPSKSVQKFNLHIGVMLFLFHLWNILQTYKALSFTNLASHLQTWPHIYKLGPTFTN